MLHHFVSLNTFISEKCFVFLMLLLYVYNLNAKILVLLVSRFCNVSFFNLWISTQRSLKIIVCLRVLYPIRK